MKNIVILNLKGINILTTKEQFLFYTLISCFKITLYMVPPPTIVLIATLAQGV